MEPKSPDLNANETKRPTRTVEDINRMISIIDDEIFRLGEGISEQKFKELTDKINRLLLEKGKLAREK